MNARLKHLVLTVAAIAGLAGVSGFAVYRTSGDATVEHALRHGDALEWLRTDFRLNDAQFAEVKRLHESYAVVCEEHCRAIQEATRERNALKQAAATDAATLAAADRKVQELRQICETAIAGHVREVASHMSPVSAERYLALVLPKIADFDHRAAPDVRLSKHAH